MPTEPTYPAWTGCPTPRGDVVGGSGAMRRPNRHPPPRAGRARQDRRPRGRGGRLTHQGRPPIRDGRAQCPDPAVLRRAAGHEADPQGRLVLGPIELDTLQHKVTVSGSAGPGDAARVRISRCSCRTREGGEEGRLMRAVWRNCLRRGESLRPSVREQPRASSPRQIKRGR